MARVLDMLPKWEKVLAAMAGGSAGSSLGYGAHDPELTAQLDELREVLLRRLDGIEDDQQNTNEAIAKSQGKSMVIERGAWIVFAAAVSISAQIF